MGVDPEDAIAAATHTPAREAGIFDRTGSITVWKAAELVIMDKDYEILEVIH